MSPTQADFVSLFKVPDVALPVIHAILRPEEILLMEALGGIEFDAAQAQLSLEEHTGESWTAERVQELLDAAYRRGVLNARDETRTRFAVGTFYGRLDVFAVKEREAYAAFSRETRTALDDWYFDAYARGLDEALQPTGDRMATLAETLEIIGRETRQIWHTDCDCRSLAGYCDKPLNTCLSMRSGPNTFAHRGVSRPVSKEEAKKIVLDAHQAGLMQTVNPNGICNCCGDCCYLFRAQALRGSGSAWPKAALVAVYQEEECIACGQCVTRCPFASFTDRAGEIAFDAALCRGCGLCQSTCPTGAIRMAVRREVPESPEA